ncbi:MAG: hypothetical protein IAE79_14825 [Anaerolinea sp.]|nr:hypothetical protein [Anaerolinea sp.]
MESHLTPTTFDSATLRGLMETHFDLDGIESLCFDLQIDFDNLEGTTKTKKVRRLIQHCTQMERLPDLIMQCRKLRPQLEWPTIPLLEPTPQSASDLTVKPALPYRKFYLFLGLGIILSGLLIMLTLTGDLMRATVATPITITTFTVKRGHVPAALVTAENHIETAVGEILTVHVLLPAPWSQMSELQFTWYTCRGGSRPALALLDNTEFIYTTPPQPGQDCIRVLLSRQGNLLSEAGLFITITE